MPRVRCSTTFVALEAFIVFALVVLFFSITVRFGECRLFLLVSTFEHSELPPTCSTPLASLLSVVCCFFIFSDCLAIFMALSRSKSFSICMHFESRVSARPTTILSRIRYRQSFCFLTNLSLFPCRWTFLFRFSIAPLLTPCRVYCINISARPRTECRKTLFNTP